MRGLNLVWTLYAMVTRGGGGACLWFFEVTIVIGRWRSRSW